MSRYILADLSEVRSGSRLYDLNAEHKDRDFVK